MVPGKRPIAIVLLALCIPVCALCFTGCQMAAPLALTSTSMGVAYYYMNMTEKTCVYDLDTMNKASLLTLKRMGFTIGDQSKDADGDRKIKAKTEELAITIKLKKITPKCTKIKVTVSKDVFVRDKATSAEIILQTEKTAELMRMR
ncbi:MAG: hypothetical protein A2Y65_12375 [Deltaproteobacteria bacterium RBG_13_52_11]|nr:MAG: hypothetical protein A2Y65_12375 [Deltaproteobacteria bacterium RBG_13_52_11]